VDFGIDLLLLFFHTLAYMPTARRSILLWWLFVIFLLSTHILPAFASFLFRTGMLKQTLKLLFLLTILCQWYIMLVRSAYDWLTAHVTSNYNPFSNMKKLALIAMAAAMPTMAGTPTIATVPAPTPAPAPCEPCCAVELAGVYNFASRDLYSVGKSVDTYGVDLTAVHSFTPNHAVTLRFGYTYGSEVDRDGGLSLREQVETISIMPGYRYTQALTDTVDLFAGVNVGVSRVRLDERAGSDADNDSDWGFAYSAELGISTKLCETVSVFAAYQFSGNTAKPCTWEVGNIHQQTYHGVRAGVSVAF